MKLSERIRHEIESAIYTGRLQPGDAINEGEIGRRHGGISRTPIREAILQLQATGLLEPSPHGGSLVTKLDIQQLLAMWELLSELEGLCARFACERMSEEQRASLLSQHQGMQHIVEANDRTRWQEANMAFHRILYEGSCNPYLREEIERMRGRTGAYRQHAFAAVNGIRDSYEQHAEITAAIQSSDPSAAQKAMTKHLSPHDGARSVVDCIIRIPRELLS